MNIDIKNIRENCQYYQKSAQRHTNQCCQHHVVTSKSTRLLDTSFSLKDAHTWYTYQYSIFLQSHFLNTTRLQQQTWFTSALKSFQLMEHQKFFLQTACPSSSPKNLKYFYLIGTKPHRISSPHCLQSNGRAEAAIKTAKRMISDYITTEHPYNNNLVA